MWLRKTHTLTQLRFYMQHASGYTRVLSLLRQRAQGSILAVLPLATCLLWTSLLVCISLKAKGNAHYHSFAFGSWSPATLTPTPTPPHAGQDRQGQQAARPGSQPRVGLGARVEDGPWAGAGAWAAAAGPCSAVCHPPWQPSPHLQLPRVTPGGVWLHMAPLW